MQIRSPTARRANEMRGLGLSMQLQPWFCIRNAADSDLITLSIFYRNIYQQREDIPCIKKFPQTPSAIRTRTAGHGLVLANSIRYFARNILNQSNTDYIWYIQNTKAQLCGMICQHSRKGPL